MKNSLSFRLTLVGVFIFLGLFLVYPVLAILKGSVVMEQDHHSVFTLAFFGMFFRSPYMLSCVGNSLLLALGTTLLSLVIAMPLAQLFAHYDFRRKALWQALLMSPMILPPFVGAIGIQQIFGKFGTLNHFLGWVGNSVASPKPFDWLGEGGFTGMVILQALHLFPVLFMNLASAMANIHPIQREAARGLGASPFRVFRTITLPLLSPGIFAGSIVIFVWAFTDLGTPLVFGFNQVVAVQIFDKVTETGFNPFGYAMVVVVLVITAGLFGWSRQWLAKRDFVTLGKSAARENLKPLQGISGWLGLLGMGTIVFFALLPHLSVILQSVSGHWFMSALPQEWTFSTYREIFTLPQTTLGLKNSFLYSSVSAVFDVVLGVLIAYWLARKDFVGKATLDMLTILPLALPGIVLAFGYVVAFNVPAKWNNWDLSALQHFINPRENPIFLLIISYSVRRLPLIVRAVHAGFQQMSVSLEDASRNLGANQSQTMKWIVLPLLRGNVLAGAVLVFAFAFLEVSDSLILAMKEKFYPTTKTIWALMGRIEPGSASIACALGVLGMLLLLAAFYLANRILGKRMGNLFG